MTLPNDRGDREYQKFRDGASAGETRVAVKIEESTIASGGVAQADKSAFTEGVTDFNPIGGVFNETAGGDPAEDEAAAARITPKRALHANLRANDGTELGTSSDPIRVDPTGATTQPISAVSLPLPTGASAEHVTAASPHAARLSDGSSFYKATTPSDTQPVSAASLPLPSGAATLSEQQTQTTSLQAIDNIPHSHNSTLSQGVPIMGRVDDTSVVTTTEDNVGQVRMTPANSLHVSLRLAGGGSAAESGSTAYFTKLYDGSGIFNVPQMITSIAGFGVPLASIVHGTTGVGLAIGAAGQIFATVAGDHAHDQAEASNLPVKIGFRAANTQQTAISADDRSSCYGDRRGHLWVDSSEFSIGSLAVTSTTDAAVIAAPGSGSKIVVYAITVSPAPASAAAAGYTVRGVEFRYASGTYRYQSTWPLCDGTVNLAVNPIHIALQHGHWNGGDNEALNCHVLAVTGSVTATFYVNVAYRILPV